MRHFILGLACLCALVPSTSRAVEIAAVGVGNFSNAHAGNDNVAAITLPYSMKFSLGFGAIVTATANPLVNLEIGALYVPRKVSYGTTSEQTFPMLEVPLLLRFDFVFFSFAAGGYYARAMGDITQSNNGVEISRSYDIVGVNKNDVGLTASARLNLPLGPIVAFIVDVRFNYGLADLDPSATSSFKLWDLQGLAGLKFAL